MKDLCAFRFSEKNKENVYLTLDKYLIESIIPCMRKKGIESQLKDALLRSRMSRYKISQLSGLSNAQLSYFVNGKRSLTLPAAAKLAKVLGFELKPKKKKAR